RAQAEASRQELGRELRSPWQESPSDSHSAEVVLSQAFQWLHVPAVVRAGRACRCWRAWSRQLPTRIADQKTMDAMLTFCLLEVLSEFSDARLPFPLTAVYGEMCAKAREATTVEGLSGRMASFVCSAHAPAGARMRHAQHVVWGLDVRQSSFKNLEKMWRHFHSKRLIDAHQQRWYKSMKNGKNTRTCCEWLLTRVNFGHQAFGDYAAAR
ncbi:unnamed protein product, partial [Prorocentrum cordatum]